MSSDDPISSRASAAPAAAHPAQAEPAAPERQDDVDAAAAAAAADAPPPGWRTYRVDHETVYDYAPPVEVAHHLAHLQPVQDGGQRLLAHRCDIAPAPAHRRAAVDAFGNLRLAFSLDQPHARLRVAASSVVQVRERPAPTPPQSALPWEAARDRLAYRAGEPQDAAAVFRFPSPYVPLHAELADYARLSFTPGRPLAEAATELMRRIHADFTYAAASTDVSTPVLQAFEQKRGVCQDFAHVLLGCLRAMGLAARYVSGYLLTHRPDEDGLPGDAASPAWIGADASHAWVAVHLPAVDPQHGAAWLELDPTNDCIAGIEHIRVALGRDYGDVTPLRGVIRGGASHTLSVRVTTRLLHELPDKASHGG
jgi:transglutaminase-like putative cysteine protease